MTASHGTTHLRLGTRRSALAWVQSSQIAAALRAAHPGLSVELVGIDTRGDRVLDVPLSSIEGKEFFTAEIDAALLEGRVDLTVHSLKDLSLVRPNALVLAAVPQRANPRDIAIFAADVPTRLQQGLGLRVGTSSPRRGQLLPTFFQRALPHAQLNRIDLVNLRGNVDSRLRRLLEPRGSDRQLDGVVLALAGLSRLYADHETERQGHSLLTELLRDLPFMVLPLNEVPGAPGQGALAIECRADDARTRQLLAALEHPATRGAIALERQVLSEHGGGCHQRFGASLQWLPDMGGLLQIAGLSSGGQALNERRWLPNTALPTLAETCKHKAIQRWDGSVAEKPAAEVLINDHALAATLKAQAVFIAHWRALPENAARLLAGRSVWTSGSTSWFRLAAQGVWVQGSSEGLGAEAAATLVAEPVLRLPAPVQWQVLTHRGAEANWNSGRWAGTQAIGTYAVREGPLPEASSLAQATHVYWHSVAQFERGKLAVPAGAHHASGPGKTAEHIRNAGIKNFRAFPSVTEWRLWTAAAH